MLKLNDIKYLYNQKAIDGISHINLTIEQGQIIGLMGPSGCGKSTLAKIIAGKITQNSGELTNLFQKTFYLEDHILNQDLTLLENLTPLASGENEDQKITEVRMALSELEITNYIETPVSKLSTGQKQRALIASALVSQADLIILDEPFSHLEAPLKEELVSIMLPLMKAKEKTLLWISHDQKLIMKYCGEIIVMNYGKIIQKSTPEAIYFFPENLESAQFFGEYNSEFLKDNKSPVWGIDFPEVQGLNPLLIYRPEAVTAYHEQERGLKAALISSQFEGSSYLHTFNLNGTEVLCRNHERLNRKHYNLSLNREMIQVLPEI